MTRTGDALMTVDQILHELGELDRPLPRRTFYRWRELGSAPPALRLPNGELRVWRSEFDKWLTNLQERAE